MENSNTESTLGVSIGHLEPISVEPPVEKLVRGDLIAVNNALHYNYCQVIFTHTPTQCE